MLLAINTTADQCAACVWDRAHGRVMSRTVADGARGHAERLIATIEDALSRAQIEYDDLSQIGVAVGPGSFAGIRTGVAAARGLALALDIRCVGVSCLDAMAIMARDEVPTQPILACLNAGRGQVFCALYSEKGTLLRPAESVNVEESDILELPENTLAAGGGVDLISNRLPSDCQTLFEDRQTADVECFARLASGINANQLQPTPLYLRPPDAKPQRVDQTIAFL